VERSSVARRERQQQVALGVAALLWVWPAPQVAVPDAQGEARQVAQLL
jgi:hypothetical protein